MRVFRFASLVVALPLLAACSGSGPVVTDDGPGDGPVVVNADYPAYEAFDPSGYDAAPPARAEIVHDVPARTMQGTVQVPGSVAGQTTERQPRTKKIAPQ